MAKTSNYYWWTPPQWREKLESVGFNNLAEEVYNTIKDMTHHERRLYIRKIIQNPRVRAVLDDNVSPDSAL